MTSAGAKNEREPMAADVGHEIRDVCEQFGNDGTRLLDIVRETQVRLGYVTPEAMDAISHWTGLPRAQVAHVVTFYAFFSDEPQGRVVIRLCDDVIDRMAGYEKVLAEFENALGITLGETTGDGLITLTKTPCIGMCDQAPAALVGDVVVTRLTAEKVRRIVTGLREHGDPAQLVESYGDGNNGHPLVRSMVRNNIRRPGPILLSDENRGAAISKALAMSPAEVIRAVKTARLRGYGGAGFPTGMKWEFARAAKGDRKLIFGNADEGEPGTFKDRVLLTERADRVFAGMTVAGYAVGAHEGILYLRGEYAYLRPFLEDVLERRRTDGLLGEEIRGRNSFAFDIRIQLGAGSYVCGAETALLRSCEGGPGEPLNRPPFPVEAGYLGLPSVVNNIETLACVTKILEEGAATFSEYGIKPCSGTKLLSISGDCDRPGVYEVPLGVELSEVLELCGGEEAAAVLVGGPSGQMIGPDQFHKTISFDDLSTGGALILFGSQRSVPEIVTMYMEFFVEESCGHCVPCRVGNVLLKERLDRILSGLGEPGDLEYLEELGMTVKRTSRCGLGQCSPNSYLSSLESFRPAYEALLKADPDGFQRSFDLEESLLLAGDIRTRLSVRGEEARS